MSTDRVAFETPRGTITSGDVVGEIHTDRADGSETYLRVAVEETIYRVDADAVSRHE